MDKIKEIEGLVEKAWDNGILDCAARNAKDRRLLLGFIPDKIDGDVPTITAQIQALIDKSCKEGADAAITAYESTCQSLIEQEKAEIFEEILIVVRKELNSIEMSGITTTCDGKLSQAYIGFKLDMIEQALKKGGK